MTTAIDPSSSRAESDAMRAWGFACSLDGATAERRAATMQVMLNSYDCDARRVEAAVGGVVPGKVRTVRTRVGMELRNFWSSCCNE